MVEWLESLEIHGDPSRIHAEAMSTRVALENAREEVASFLGTRSRSVVFTSGATESIAAAVWGAAERGGHMVVPAIEHSAVRLAAEAHARVTFVGCDGRGRVDPDAVLDAIEHDTSLVHLQLGNHEVGTLQPVAEVVGACRQRGVLVHVDAAQAIGKVPIGFDDLGADLVSVTSHKMGGPAGIGALLIRRGLRVRPLLVGGDQERARRAGLESTLAAMGWAAACRETDIASEAEAMTRHTTRLIAAAETVDGVALYGAWPEALPHLACFGIDGIEPQAVLLGLDQSGIACHSGSACASEDLQPSPVLEAMGVDAERSLRVSVGWSTVDDDVEAFVAALPEVVARLRALSPLSP
jgi:cysteine desulfurase